ncbi:MAG: hypothetical protein ACFFDT_14475 [Candidatus Hodarchaeota archaeon]
MNDFQDIIIKESDPVKIVNTDKWVEIIFDSNYFSIIKLLNEGYKTIEEIYCEFNRKKDVIAKSTLYRHVRFLIEKEFVIKSGRRIKKGQSATENLYGKAGRLFLPENPWKKIWYSSSGIEISQIVGRMIKHHFNNKNPHLHRLYKFIKEQEDAFSQMALAAVEKITQTNYIFEEKRVKKEQEKADLALAAVNELTGDDAIVFFTLIGWITWFIEKENYKQFISDLKDCFSDDSPLIHKPVEEIEIQSNKSSNQDFIMRYQQIVKFIPSELVPKYFYELNFRAILYILESSSKPMTIKEIHALHYDTIRKISEDEKQSNLEYDPQPVLFRTYKPKAENTVYRYVQDLIQNGLVIEAGRRIYPEKPFTQILYTTAAEFFILLENSDEFWKYDGWKQVIRALAFAVRCYLDKKTVDHEKFHNLVTNMEKARLKLLKKLLASSEIPYLRQIKPHEKPNAAIRILGLIEWFLMEEDKENLQKQLLSCFSD